MAVNKQNCHIWVEGIQDQPLHLLQTIIWCGLWAGGINGQYFFKDEAGANVEVNSERYRAMINNFLMPEIEAPYLHNIWFIGSNKTALLAMQPMKQWIGEQFISRHGPLD